MQLFSRRVLAGGPPSKSMAFAAEMRALVSDTIGREVTLWNGLFGVPVGSMFYSMRIEGIGELSELSAKLAASPDYVAKLDAGDAFRSGMPPEDMLATPLYGDLDGDQPPVGSYAGIVMAEIDNGMYEEALAWGADMAAFAEEVTGLPELFLVNNFGPFGGVTWIQGAPDAAAVDAGMAKLNGNPDYLKRLGSSKGMFRPGSGMQGLINRIA